MRSIAEIKAFEDSFELIRLPEARIIGKAIRNGGSLGNTAPSLWDQVYSSEDHLTLSRLPNLIHEDFFGWTCEYDSVTDTFVYIVCALAPADTPVPDGFTYRDVPETVCAKGLFGESVMQTVARAKSLGYTTNWAQPGCGWNAELYFHAEEERPPKQCSSPWHWLVPVVKLHD